MKAEKQADIDLALSENKLENLLVLLNKSDLLSSHEESDEYSLELQDGRLVKAKLVSFASSSTSDNLDPINTKLKDVLKY